MLKSHNSGDGKTDNKTNKLFSVSITVSVFKIHTPLKIKGQNDTVLLDAINL